MTSRYEQMRSMQGIRGSINNALVGSPNQSQQNMVNRLNNPNLNVNNNTITTSSKLLVNLNNAETQLYNLQQQPTKSNKYNNVKAKVNRLQSELKKVESDLYKKLANPLKHITQGENVKDLERTIRRERNPNQKAALENQLRKITKYHANSEKKIKAIEAERAAGTTPYIGGKRTRRSTKKSRRTRSNQE